MSELEFACIGLGHLAQRLGISLRTVRRMIERGELPVIKVGRRTLVELAEVRKWLAGCEVSKPAGRPTNISRQYVSR